MARVTRQSSASANIIRSLRKRTIFLTEKRTRKVMIRPPPLVGTYRTFKRKHPTCEGTSKVNPTGPLELIESIISRNTSILKVFIEDMADAAEVHDQFTNAVSLIRKGKVIPTCKLRAVVRSLRKSGVFIRSPDKKKSLQEFSKVILVKKRIEAKDLKSEKAIYKSQSPLIRKLAMRKSCGS